MKRYDIYAKGKCIFLSLDEREFAIVWQTLIKMIDILKTDYTVEDLSFEEVID